MKGQGIRSFVYPYLVPLFFAAGIEIHRHGQDEYIPLLCLPDIHRLYALLLVPMISNIQYGMTGPVIPLVEEPVEIPSAGFFHGQTQLLRFGAAISIVREIDMETPVKGLIAQIIAQHIQDAPALLI